jgi:O-antigen/teichoic acid export membrane protein
LKIYTKKNIFDNIANILLNQVITKIISLATVTMIVRVLGPASFGDYSFSLAIIGYSMLFVQFGTSTYGVKQINQSSDDEKYTKTVSNIISLRLLLVGIIFLCLIVAYIITNSNIVIVLFILSISTVAGALNLDWYFRGVLKNKWVLIAGVMQSLTQFFIVLLAFNHFNIYWACVSYSGSFVVFSVVQYFAYRRLGNRIQLRFMNLTELKNIYNEIWPYFFSGLAGLVLFNTDTIFLKIYTNSEMVGFYNSAHRVVDVFTQLRFGIISVFFPVFSQMFAMAPNKLLRNFYISSGFVLLGMTMISSFICIFSDNIIGVLFGTGYAYSASVLKYLVFTSVILFARTFINGLYLAIGKSRLVFIFDVMAAVLNIVLNAIFVAKYQVMGAIFSTIAALTINVGVMLFFFKSSAQMIQSVSLEPNR